MHQGNGPDQEKVLWSRFSLLAGLLDRIEGESKPLLDKATAVVRPVLDRVDGDGQFHDPLWGCLEARSRWKDHANICTVLTPLGLVVDMDSGRVDWIQLRDEWQDEGGATHSHMGTLDGDDLTAWLAWNSILDKGPGCCSWTAQLARIQSTVENEERSVDARLGFLDMAVTYVRARHRAINHWIGWLEDWTARHREGQ